jgi:ribosomal protein S6
MNEKDSNVGTLEVNNKVYEISALFVPELEGEALSQTVDSLKSKLKDLGAEIISEGAPVHIKLAYTVEKHINNKIRRADFAHFYWVKFEVDPSKIKVLETFFKLDLNEKVLRHLLVKTVRENTVLTELTEAKLADVKNEELIDEVLATDVKAEAVDENAITDLGGDTPLVKAEDAEAADEATK